MTKDIICAADFVDEPYHQVAEIMYEQYETNGRVEPATIISRFQSREEQTLVAGIFNKEVKAINKDSEQMNFILSLVQEQMKAVNEVVRSIKKYSLDYRSRHVTDIKELQKLIEEKKQLQTLQLTFK